MFLITGIFTFVVSFIEKPNSPKNIPTLMKIVDRLSIRSFS